MNYAMQKTLGAKKQRPIADITRFFDKRVQSKTVTAPSEIAQRVGTQISLSLYLQVKHLVGYDLQAIEKNFFLRWKAATRVWTTSSA